VDNEAWNRHRLTQTLRGVGLSLDIDLSKLGDEAKSPLPTHEELENRLALLEYSSHKLSQHQHYEEIMFHSLTLEKEEGSSVIAISNTVDLWKEARPQTVAAFKNSKSAKILLQTDWRRLQHEHAWLLMMKEMYDLLDFTVLQKWTRMRKRCYTSSRIMMTMTT